MLIDTKRVLAMRCPQCGRLEIYSFSLFELEGPKPLTIYCQCGFALIDIIRRGRLYIFHIACIVCEATHELLVDVKSVLRNDAAIIYCPDSDVDLGIVGHSFKVDELVAEEDDVLANVVGPGLGDVGFANVSIMREVLNRLQIWVDADRLYCSCGNYHMELELFPTRWKSPVPCCGGTLGSMPNGMKTCRL